VHRRKKKNKDGSEKLLPVLDLVERHTHTHTREYVIKYRILSFFCYPDEIMHPLILREYIITKFSNSSFVLIMMMKYCCSL
jgi:hypothetical protein